MGRRSVRLTRLSMAIAPMLATAPALAQTAGTDSAITSLNDLYDKYSAFKDTLSQRYNLDVSMDVSIYPQFGAPNGGKPVWLLVYSPNVTWKPFSDTAIGSGEFNFSFGSQQYWTGANTASQAANMGIISYPNDWLSNGYSWYTVAYTHTLPGALKFVSVTVGQFNLGTFDPNSYAADPQNNFISYPFAQDATQTYPNAGLGSYVTVKTPDGQVAVSGGFQGATNLDGSEITTRGFQTGKYTYFGNIQWTPTFASLGDGTYSLLYYQQPAVPDAPTVSNGISFSASQAIGKDWGAFIRINNASGATTAITTSVAVGGIRQDPFGRNASDQAGFAFAWDKTNFTANGVTPDEARPAELAGEFYYVYSVFKGLQVTPDIQMFLHPALAPHTSTAAVFTIRSTILF
jgi:hypothetical protein